MISIRRANPFPIDIIYSELKKYRLHIVYERKLNSFFYSANRQQYNKQGIALIPENKSICTERS